MRNLTTHAEGCWNWGARHYQCALLEVEHMQDELLAAKRDAQRWRAIDRRVLYIGMLTDQADVEIELAATMVALDSEVRPTLAAIADAIAEEYGELARDEAAELLAAERERCAAICDAIEDQAWARWRGTAPDLGDRALYLLQKHDLLGGPLRGETMPADCPTATGCREHGCHGACLGPNASLSGAGTASA